MKKTDLARDNKRKLKEVIDGYVLNAAFVKSNHKNKPEQIMKKISGRILMTDQLKKTFKQCGKWQKKQERICLNWIGTLKAI